MGAVAVAAIVGAGALLVRATGDDQPSYRTADADTQTVQAALTGVATIEPIDQAIVGFPADGTVSTSANQIVLTASEPVTAPGVLLDGGAAPAPAVSGNQLTFPTGLLAEVGDHHWATLAVALQARAVDGLDGEQLYQGGLRWRCG